MRTAGKLVLTPQYFCLVARGQAQNWQMLPADPKHVDEERVREWA